MPPAVWKSSLAGMRTAAAVSRLLAKNRSVGPEHHFQVKIMASLREVCGAWRAGARVAAVYEDADR